MADTKFKKGHRSPGRPKGSENKVTSDLKAMIQEALHNAGGAEYLTARANDPRTASAFLSLLGKVLPMQVTGANGGPLMTVTRIELVAPDRKD